MSASNPGSSESVGSLLRRTREARGIAIEEAARVTRIGQSYLVALEADRFDSLPNSAYAKGFLRAYAAFLGISGDEAVSMYERSLAPPPAEWDKNKDPGSESEHKVQSRTGKRWVLPLVLLAFIAIAAYFLDDRRTLPEKAQSPPPAAPPAQPAVVPVLQPTTSSRIANETAPVQPDEVRTETAVAGTQKGLVLKLKVQQDCWLHITIDDAISQQYDLKEGDLIEWKGSRVFALDVGNAGGIEAELNGRQLKSFGEAGKPAHVVLKAADVPQQER